MTRARAELLTGLDFSLWDNCLFFYNGGPAIEVVDIPARTVFWFPVKR